jgi:Ca-activated chloride channel family protein
MGLRNVWALFLMTGCSLVHHGTTSNSKPLGGNAEGFVPTTESYSPPTADELLREAHVGTHAGVETGLTSRMQLRPLSFPKPPRGATARFNLPDGKRGWVTSMLNSEVLTTPAFAGGKLFLGGGFASHEMYALAAYSGEHAWSAAAPDGGPSSPIYEDGAVIFNTESCELFVVDAETGKQRWSKWLGDPLMSQPAAADATVFSAYPVAGGHEFGAFRLKDGAPLWKVSIPADVIQAPQIQGDSVYLATMDGSVLRIARANGQVRWRREVGAASVPAVDGRFVLLSRKVGAEEQPIVLAADDGKLLRAAERQAAPWFNGTSRDRQLAQSQAGAWGSVPHGDWLGLANVAAGWAYQGSSPAVADGRAYYAVGGDIRAREVATGRQVWQRTYAEAQGAQAVTPPVAIGGSLVFGTVDGHLYGVDIDTGMTEWAYNLAEPIVFQPIVAQGWVYATTARGHVVALELGDPSFDGWHMWGGNSEHSGLVETAGNVDPALLASLSRPGMGTLRTAEEGKDLPLAGTTVHAKVSGTVARVEVVQHFQNPFDKALEAVYLFPLPDDSAIDDMEMRIGERVVKAKIQRRAQAQQTYSEAKASGKRAALLEQQRPNLFAERVANIAPGERIDVSLSYAQNIALGDEHYELTFPMVAPERVPPAPVSDVVPAVFSASSAAPPVAGGRGVASSPLVELEVELDAGLPLSSLTSPSHAISTLRPTASTARVRLTDKTPANRDFVMRWSLGGSLPTATVLAHKDGDAGYFSLLVQPPAASAGAPIAPRDVTLLIDTSSSMRGKPLEHARAVGRAILDQLRPADSLRVLTFAERVTAVDPLALPATADNVKRAREFLDAQRAVGATDMQPALHAALEGKDDPSRVRLVVLVSDGFIGNEADVLAELSRQLGRARLYAFGIGSSINRFLLERATEIGRGRALWVTPSEDPTQAAARFAALIDRPVFTDVAIDWGGLPVTEVYPRRVPDLFASQPLVLTGRYARGQKGVVRVRGTYGGKRYERVLNVDLPQAPTTTEANLAQRSLWARAAVHDRLNALTLNDDPHLVEEVTTLGIQYRLMTPWTSFVAVDGAGPIASQPETSQALLSPARALPGDPEIRISAPADSRAVSVDLPFGETIAAHWDEELGVWIARFLIPKDDAEGMHSVRVTITDADGRTRVRSIGYTVDSAPPRFRVEVLGAAGPGSEVTLRATQVSTAADREQAGLPATGPLSPLRELMLKDARRVEARLPSGVVRPLFQRSRGTWETTLRIPEGAQGEIDVHLFGVDVAANVSEQRVAVRVLP